MDRSNIFTWEKIDMRKKIALGLVLISFIALVFPWITMSVEVLGEKYTMQDLMNLVYAEADTTQSGYEAELRGHITEIAEEAAKEGIQINVNKMMGLLRMILKGKISPVDCATKSAFLSGILGDVVDAANNSADASGMFAIIKQIENAKTSMTTAAVVMWLTLVLMTAGMIYAVHSLLTGKKYGVMIYAGISALTFVVFVIATNKLNGAGYALFGGIYDLLDDMNLLAGNTAKLDMFHLSAAPFICVIAGIAAVVVEKVTYSDRQIPVFSVKKWVCSCGNANDDNDQFCCVCGQKRQQEKVCTCGAALKPGAGFCTVCGKKVADILSDGGSSNEGSSNGGLSNGGSTNGGKSNMDSHGERKAICPYCGARQSSENINCKYCGTPMQ